MSNNPRRKPLRSGFWTIVVGAAAIALILAACSETGPEDSAAVKRSVVVAKDNSRPAPVSAVRASPSLYGNYLAGLHARAQNVCTAGETFMGQV
ncbi:MAG: hypothetical protein Q8L63_02995, partial [Alphaproteobacteria bacterium]|nr:hypothetical protein [Alphaproteobacteria bacterium]